MDELLSVYAVLVSVSQRKRPLENIVADWSIHSKRK
jgi:hypothetical protein